MERAKPAGVPGRGSWLAERTPLRTIAKPRLAWEDRYRRPRAEDLLAPYSKPTAHLVELARERLTSFDGISEEVSWQGIPWRWTFVYRSPDEAPRAWAYLVPDPAKPLLALPLMPQVTDTLRIKRLSRFIRDRIVFATQVNGIRWAQWEIAGKGQLEEVLELAACKHTILAASA